MVRPASSRTRAGTCQALLALFAIALLPACGDRNDVLEPTPPIPPTPQAEQAERFDFGDFSLYLPPVSTIRGMLLALGGPDTRGFASGGPFGGPAPELEASLQALGEEFRAMAASRGIAVLGTSRAAMDNDPDSDGILLDAIRQASVVSGRPELESSPLLLYGISEGGPEASGFAARNPARVAGLFLKVPAGFEPLAGAEPAPVLRVPTYVVLAEQDALVDDAALAVAFLDNRRAGALWALALEPGVPHHALTPEQRAITTGWLDAILQARIGASHPGTLRTLSEDSGWFGSLSDGSVGAVANSWGAPVRGASWFPSQATAEAWKAFVEGALPLFSLTVEPEAIAIRPGESARLVPTVQYRHRELSIDPGVTFSSNNEGVAIAYFDQSCSPACGYVHVEGIAAGVAHILAEYGSAWASATVTVSWPASGSVIDGAYDLTATITGFDPAWGDLTGYLYTAVLTFEHDPRAAGGIGGTFSEFRLTGPGGEEDWVRSGALTGYFDFFGRLTIVLVSDHFHFQLTPAGDLLGPAIQGSFFTGGHIGGPFTAVRRDAG